jgi:hypothetical protein
MPRKKKMEAIETDVAPPAAEAPERASKPEPFHAATATELGSMQKPFHAGQCDRCVHYKPAHYIAASGDLERALSGARIVMGFCVLHRKQLTTATRDGCGDFDPVSAREKRRPQREGDGEWVLR